MTISKQAVALRKRIEAEDHPISRAVAEALSDEDWEIISRSLEEARPTKRTSAIVSSLASLYLAMNTSDLMMQANDPEEIDQLLKDIKTLAASCLSQDERPAKRRKRA